MIIGKSLQDDYDSNIIISDISDHFPSMVRMYKPSLFTKKSTRIETRALNDNKIEMIRKQIDEIDWKQVLLDKDTDEAHSLFHDKIQTIIHDTAPLKTISIKPQKMLQQPWMTPGLQKCQQKQYMLYKQSINQRENKSAEMKYKTYRNKLKENHQKNKGEIL